MSEPTPTPGKSLESDLQLIREARGISREEIFNRVHIRPEVLAQVEEHGFGATPTLNSDIHRRSFVKHFADAVEIDADVALAALTKSLTGFYDGSLAVEYLGLEDLKSVPRWAQQSDETQAETDVQSDETLADADSESDETPADADSEGDETPADADSEGDETSADADSEADGIPTPLDFNVVPAEPEIPAFEVESGPQVPEAGVLIESAIPESDVPEAKETQMFPAPEHEPADESAPDVIRVPKPEPEPDSEPDLEQPVSPYAPPSATSVQAPPPRKSTPAVSSPQTPEPQTPGPQAPEPQAPEPPTSPVSLPGASPATSTAFRDRSQREATNIPSSTLKESAIGPPDESIFGDEAGFWLRLRGRHWLTWIGLTGVAIVLIVIVGQTFFEENKKVPEVRTGIAEIADLPDQFSGIVRLTPTTERFVNLQIVPDSLSQTEFVYKIWTDSDGSIYAEAGKGRLNLAEKQILFDEPYGVGGLFFLDGGAVSIRSVRRIRFPRWEFTGQIE